MNLFRKRPEPPQGDSSRPADFAWLEPGSHYFDSACQTLRPQPVIDAVISYFHNHPACGGRVRYTWGEAVDRIVASTRQQLLEFTGKSEKDYTTTFCLNTTAGVNLILQQLRQGRFRRIVTSEIEHNSVFLPTLTCARRFHLERLVLPREADGSLAFRPDDLEQALVVVSTTSNIDGRSLGNLADLVTAAHHRGGAVLLDAAQTLGHHATLLHNVSPDAICGSSHKMYGPSLGFVIIRKAFLKELDCFFLGGGTVSAVHKDDFDLLDSPDEPFARLEPGLQDFAGIAGLGAAIDWLGRYRPENQDPAAHQHSLACLLYDSLRANPRLKLFNHGPSPILSFHSEHIDAHRLALYLSAQNIMVRSGYFCCHYYLETIARVPPLLRISLGLQNTAAETAHTAEVINHIVNHL